MSVSFNEELSNLKQKIQQQCILYRSNFLEFLQLINTIKVRNYFNYKDINQSEQLLTQMNNGEVRIIFCGQVKSGKSRCVMEFLSGSINLPSKDVPATAFFTKILYSEKHFLYSKNSNGIKEYFKFNGKTVDESLVGKRNNFVVEEKNLDLIFNIGINDNFLKNGVIVIDSPGLNETQSMDDAFKINLTKLNPQIVLYIFNYGPGFVDSDIVYNTTVIASLRNDLREIFIFNKFDKAFDIQIKFPNSDDDDNSENSSVESREDEIDESDDDSEADDDEEPKDFDIKYSLEFDRHKRKLEEVDCGNTCPCLIGYSGRYVQLHRTKKDNRLMQLRFKHIELFEHVRCNINSMNIETTDKMISFINQFLFLEFKIIFEQILNSDNTSQRHNLLIGTNKEKILEHFDTSHDKLINIVISQIPQINFDGAISQIVKNQERLETKVLKTKISNIINSLAKFFVDRYVNYFSNIILTKLEEISFEKLNDELRQKEIDNLFSHTFCSLAFETEKIENVIKPYFDEEVNRINSENLELFENNLQTSQGCTFYIKNKFKFQKEFVWVNVESFIKNSINIERNFLEKSIDEKKEKVSTDFKMSKEQTNEAIKNSQYLIKTWLNFNNNYIMELITSNFTENKKKDILRQIVNDSKIKIEEINKLSNSLNIFIKCEKLIFEKISYDNCEFIKYFLRSQYISSNICDVNVYYQEKEEKLYFITDLKEFEPLRFFLNKNHSKTENVIIIKKLISALLTCYNKCLPFQNFSPDMVFCKKSTESLEIKLGESIQKFDEWKYTLHNGELSRSTFYKYPFFLYEKEPSMFYGLSWTILIILHGCCEDIITSKVNISTFEKEMAKIFPTMQDNEIFIGCSKIIRMYLQRPFKLEKMSEAAKIFEDIIEKK